MHFHLPKPLHGWREFVGEVGIIVIGVLIALGAEQLLESWRDRHAVEEMDGRLRQELSLSVTNAYERLIINRCITGRIAQLRDLLVRSDGHWSGQPARFGGNFYVNAMPSVYRVPNRSWPTSVWRAANATGIIDKASDAQSARFSELYSSVDMMDSLQQQERSEEAELGDLAFDTRLTDAERNEHLRTLAKLDNLNARMTNYAEAMMESAAKAGISLSPKNRADQLNMDRQFRGDCVEDLQPPG